MFESGAPTRRLVGVAALVLVTACLRGGEESGDPLTTAFNLLDTQDGSEVSLFEGHLRVVNLHQVQVTTAFQARNLPLEEQIPRFVESVYRPYQSFWEGYLGDEKAFAGWIESDWDFGSDARWRIPLQVDFPQLITETAERMRQLTGRTPEGTWYLVYGPGWTNMGGLGDGVMVVDFFGIATEDGAAEIRFGLPHELNHMLFDASHGNDDSRGTLLARIIDEGFAAYVNYEYWEREHSPAPNLGYGEEEWAWAVQHEADILRRALPDFDSKDREIHNQYVARSVKLWPNAPGAIGYFLGFRVVEAYVERHGPGSWRDLYERSLGQILRESDYAEEPHLLHPPVEPH